MNEAWQVSSSKSSDNMEEFLNIVSARSEATLDDFVISPEIASKQEKVGSLLT